MRKFNGLKELFETLQEDLDTALQIFAESTGSVWLLDTGILLDTGYILDTSSGGLQTPHAYRDQYAADAPKEERLFIVYSLSGQDEVESADGGAMIVTEPEFLIRVYADKRWTRSNRDSYGTYMSLLDYLTDTLYEYGWTTTQAERVGDVDSIGYETYVFYCGGLIIKDR